MLSYQGPRIDGLVCDEIMFRSMPYIGCAQIIAGSIGSNDCYDDNNFMAQKELQAQQALAQTLGVLHKPSLSRLHVCICSLL